MSAPAGRGPAGVARYAGPRGRQASKQSPHARILTLMDAYIRAVTFMSRVAGVFAALLIGFAVLVICDMVVERYIFNLTTIWQIDVVTYSIVAATFVGSAYVLMTRGHVNVDVLPLYLAPT